MIPWGRTGAPSGVSWQTVFFLALEIARIVSCGFYFCTETVKNLVLNCFDWFFHEFQRGWTGWIGKLDHFSLVGPWSIEYANGYIRIYPRFTVRSGSTSKHWILSPCSSLDWALGLKESIQTMVHRLSWSPTSGYATVDDWREESTHPRGIRVHNQQLIPRCEPSGWNIYHVN